MNNKYLPQRIDWADLAEEIGNEIFIGDLPWFISNVLTKQATWITPEEKEDLIIKLKKVIKEFQESA